MNFFIHNIESPQLKPYVQYILFNSNHDPQYDRKLTSYANTNFCLGIARSKKLVLAESGEFAFDAAPAVCGYLTGMYLQPIVINVTGIHDEICIDFTPLGFCRYFRFPAKTFMLDQPVLEEAFGKDAGFFFEQVFDETDRATRGRMIERYLLQTVTQELHPLVANTLADIENDNQLATVGGIARKENCGEKKIYRLFTETFDISPKEFLRIKRFRNTLHHLNRSAGENHTKLAYETGFYDQAHYSREFKFFTGLTPTKANRSINLIQEKVWIGF